VQIRYTTDGTEPGIESPVYTTPFTLNQTTTIKANAWQGNQLLGKTYSNQLTIHKATGKPYTLSVQPDNYKGGEQFALTNGVTGNMRTWNAWVGLSGRDLDPVIDLGESTIINRVYTHYVNSKRSWIHPPKSIEVLVSDDGISFRSEGIRKIDSEEKMNSGKERVLFSLAGVKARYIKVVATNIGTIPEGYQGAGQNAWLFLDEIVVE
jgi:hexosaminidase